MSDAFEVAALELFGSVAALLESTGKLTEKVCGIAKRSARRAVGVLTNRRT